MLSIKTTQVPYHASKWLSVGMLVDFEEMHDFLHALGPFFMYPLGMVIPKGQDQIKKEDFLTVYHRYIEDLKQGRVPEVESFRSAFSCALSLKEDCLYALAVGEDRQLVRVLKPVVQMQAHTLDYSPADGKFRSMVLGQDSIFWGLQFSYPQLYEEPDTRAPQKVDSRYVNSALFRQIQKWVRENTMPTPFVVDGQVINVPMRLGKQCLTWINNHPQFLKKNLSVRV